MGGAVLEYGLEVDEDVVDTGDELVGLLSEGQQLLPHRFGDADLDVRDEGVTRHGEFVAPATDQIDRLGAEQVVRYDFGDGVLGDVQLLLFDEEGHEEGAVAPRIEFDGGYLAHLEAIDDHGIRYGEAIDALVDGMVGPTATPGIEPLQVIDAQYQQRTPNEDEQTDLDFPAFLHPVLSTASVPASLQGFFEWNPAVSLECHHERVRKAIQLQGIAHPASHLVGRG